MTFDCVLLDAGPLGKLAHPKPAEGIRRWMDGVVAAGLVVVVPAIADYEVRRELLRAGLHGSVARLDWCREFWSFLPITTQAMDLAAVLWAEARRRGRPSAGPERLDGDAILAAQAQLLAGTGRSVVVATDNIQHLAQFVDARLWSDISPS